MRKLHPAVVRPGRLLAEIAFGPMSAKQANGWLRKHNSDAIIEAPTTLAEFYAVAAGRSTAALA